MALDHMTKKRYRDAAHELLGSPVSPDAAEMLEWLLPQLQETEGEEYAYKRVLPSVPSDGWKTANQVRSAMGASEADLKRVQVALNRLTKEGAVVREKRSEGCVYQKAGEE